MQIQFGKKEAQIVKGIAISMMLVHHLFGFKSWIDPSNMYIDLTVLDTSIYVFIAKFCKLCVGLYVFMTGYSLAIQEDSLSYKTLAKKAFAFLKQYWILFILVLCVGFLLKEPLPDIKRFIFQAFGLLTATGFDGKYNTSIHCNFAWYVSFYLLFLFLFPILKKLEIKNFWIGNLVTISTLLCIGNLLETSTITPPILISIVSRFKIYASIGMLGYSFYKHKVFENINASYIGNGTLLCFLIACMFLRWHLNKLDYDILFTPILVLILLTWISRIHVFDQVFIALGKHSTNIWFLHSLFFTPNKTLQWVAYLPKYPPLVWIWVICIMLILSIFLKKIMKRG